MGITSPHRHEQKIMQMKVTSEQAKQLLTDQLSVWESARDNYKALEAVQVKELTVEGCTVKIQFNPARIVSSAAKVDTQSLKERKCFLCAKRSMSPNLFSISCGRCSFTGMVKCSGNMGKGLINHV